MAFSQLKSMAPTLTILLFLSTFLALIDITLAADSKTQYVTSTDAAGETIYLADNRKPALYTQNFGDCLGSSSINVTRFDAAYYADNMTVLFHLEGNTAVANETLMSSHQLSREQWPTLTVLQCSSASPLTVNLDLI